MTNENLEIARELLVQIAAAAASGEVLALGPQAVKNLQGLIGDLLQRTDAQPDEPDWVDANGKRHRYQCGLNPRRYALKHLVDHCTCPPDEPKERPVVPFAVKHYSESERPSIKGNGFDGLEIGEDRQEAQEFVDWINSRLAQRTNEGHK